MLPLETQQQTLLNTFKHLTGQHIYFTKRSILYSCLQTHSVLSSTPHRPKLISPDICFQSKAPSLLFPLRRPAIKELTYVPKQTTRGYPSVCFLSPACPCLSSLLAASVYLSSSLAFLQSSKSGTKVFNAEKASMQISYMFLSGLIQRLISFSDNFQSPKRQNFGTVVHLS